MGNIMSKIRLYGDTSGYVDLTAPAVADNRNIDLPGVLDSKLDLAGGKILQIVRATDTTDRTTTSTSDVDVSGMSVSITPQQLSSKIIVIAAGWFYAQSATTDTVYGLLSLTDSSNTVLSGASNIEVGTQNITGTATRYALHSLVLIGYSEPNTTSSVTFKLRWRTPTSSTLLNLRNNRSAGQMYAIEVSA